MKLNVPKRPSGYVLGDQNAPVLLEVFLDIQCPFSKKAWPTLMAIRDAYGTDQVALRLQMIVLANHRQAWDMTRLVHAVAGADADKFRDFVTYLYDQQDRFFNAPFADKGHANLLNFAVEITHEWSAAEHDVAARMETDEAFAQTRIPIRHAARRGVWSTPTYFVNEVEVSNAGSATLFQEWKQALDLLLSQG
ncbi:MAG: DsbA family protein [Pikeienuella sp.]